MAKKKKRKRRYYRRKPKRRYGKKRILGVLGKSGAIILGVAPLGSSALSAANRARAASGLSILEKVQFWFYRFLNDLSTGFGLPEPYDRVQIGNTSTPIGNSWGGSTPHLYTSMAGGAMIAADFIVSKLLKRSTRIAGVPLTGKY